MPKGTKNMAKKSDEQLIIIQAAIETKKQELKAEMKSNKKDSDEKMTQFTENLNILTAFMMDQTNISKSSQTHKYTLTLWNLPQWSQITRGLHHFKGDTLPKLVACGPSNMRSDRQNSMSSS